MTPGKPVPKFVGVIPKSDSGRTVPARMSHSIGNFFGIRRPVLSTGQKTLQKIIIADGRNAKLMKKNSRRQKISITMIQSSSAPSRKMGEAYRR
jgi:hypothetical protein